MSRSSGKRKIRRSGSDLFRRITSGFRKLPEFLIIGAQKGGTSSLAYYLRQHPRLFLPKVKEVHYFDRFFDRALSWYRRFFPFQFSKSITGEATPYYLFHPQVPYRVKDSLPNVKLIVLLRDPLERAYSHYSMEKRRGTETLPFEEALEREKERTRGEMEKLLREEKYHSSALQQYSYIARGRYHEQLERWFRHFSWEQFLILKSEDLFQDPKGELAKVYDLLGVDHIPPEDLGVRNSDSFGKLSDEIRREFLPYFREDQEKLRLLLGNHFHWEEG